MKTCMIKLLILVSLLLGFAINVNAQTNDQNPPPCSTIVSEDLCEKIGQLLLIGFGGHNEDDNGKVIWDDPNSTIFKTDSNIAKDIRELHIGGIYFSRLVYRNKKTGEFIRDRNVQNAIQLTHLTTDLQNYNSVSRKKQGAKDIPLFTAIDQEGGLVNTLSFAPGLPNYIPQALGLNQSINANDPQKRQAALNFTYNYAKQTAAFAHQYGINLIFAPDADVNVNPVNPIIGGLGRSYSPDPQTVADQDAEVIKAFHSQYVLATIKHFPGHGSSAGDSHLGLVDVTNTYQKERELFPFKKLIEDGYQDIVMSTHVINGQIDRSACLPGDPNDPGHWCPGTMSYATLTDLLRNQMKFKGVIVSDDINMKAIADNYPLSTALEKGLNAGVDIFIVANHYADDTARIVNTIAQLVKSGKVQESRIDEAYQRVMQLKQRIK